MKIMLEREPLHRVLSDIANVVDRVKVEPILGNIKWQFTKEEMILTATDTELQMTAKLPVPQGEAVEEFETTLGAKKLLDITSNFKDDTLTLEFEGSNAVVRTDRSTFTLATMPAEGFPVLDLEQSEHTLSISKKILRKLLHAVSFLHFSERYSGSFARLVT